MGDAVLANAWYIAAEHGSMYPCNMKLLNKLLPAILLKFDQWQKLQLSCCKMLALKVCWPSMSQLHVPAPST